MADFFDSWGERIGLPGGTLLALRVGWWFIRRRRGGATNAPLIDWVARRLVVETALLLRDLENKVLEAENRRLRDLMEDAGIPSGSGESNGSSFDLPGLTPMRSRRTRTTSSAATSPSPDDDQW